MYSCDRAIQQEVNILSIFGMVAFHIAHNIKSTTCGASRNDNMWTTDTEAPRRPGPSPEPLHIWSMLHVAIRKKRPCINRPSTIFGPPTTPFVDPMRALTSRDMFCAATKIEKALNFKWIHRRLVDTAQQKAPKLLWKAPYIK